MTNRPGLPKLVATDLDGTLVRSDETVSAYTHDVLTRVRGAGIPVVGVTGRGPRLIDLCLRDMPNADFFVLAQGARVVDLTGVAEDGERRVLREAYLDGLVVAGVLDQLEAVVGPLSVMVEALDGPDEPLWGELHHSWPYPDRVESRPRRQALAGAVLKAFAHSERYTPDQLIEICGQILPPGMVTVTQAGLGYLEICPPKVSKASGLAVVAEAIGVDPAEIAVFGDMPNDIPMFAWAGWRRVAVANAHPAVLAAADEVTLSNDEDGVAVWLDGLLNGRR